MRIKKRQYDETDFIEQCFLDEFGRSQCISTGIKINNVKYLKKMYISFLDRAEHFDT